MQPDATQYCVPVLPRIITIFAVCSVALFGCTETTVGSDAQLRQWVADSQALVEAEERRDLIERISPDYSGSMGYQRDDLNKVFRAYFLRQNNVNLLVSIEDVRVFGDTAAEIDLKVGMAGTNDGLLGFSADASRFELELQKEGGAWILISAHWGALGEELK